MQNPKNLQVELRLVETKLSAMETAIAELPKKTPAYRRFNLEHTRDYLQNQAKFLREVQQLAVAIWKASKAERYDYGKACEALKEANLYEDGGYKYGSQWLYRPLPREVIEETLKLCE
jgi:hypothetical protein